MAKLGNDIINKLKNKPKGLINKKTIAGESKNMIASKFFAELIFSSSQIHIFHLMTSSYPHHMALGTFYEEMPGLVDGLVEIYQGTNGLIKNYPSNVSIKSEYDPVGYLVNLRNMIQTARESVCMQPNFQNAVDGVLDLIDSTLYKLTKLQ
jgi:hypothetical protein